ncbi:MAG: 2-C-methyl-D-erythritol 4-phosphate cytidylyltransferase [Kiritimatiellia bacterium]
MVTAIVLASGKGTRMGADLDKCFLSLGPKPVVAWSLLAFERCSEIGKIILTVRKDQLAAARGLQTMFGISKLQKLVVGGTRRQDSVAAALKEIDADTNYVVVHDGARPCVSPELISETLKYAKRFGSGIAAHPSVDTIKIVGAGMIVESTPARASLWAVQTPQAFQVEKLQAAYAQFGADKTRDFSDDAAIVEATGVQTRLVKWTAPNPKITTPIDLTIAAAILQLR